MYKIILLSFFLVNTISLTAATFFVDVTIDEMDGSCVDGDCSLRDAVALAGAGDIVNVPAGTYTTSVQLVLNGESLIGEDAATTIIQAAATRGTATHGVLSINAGTSFVLSNLTIRHGVSSTFEAGGIVAAGGTSNTVSGTITDCIIVDNESAASFSAGGILISSTATVVTIERCKVQSNSSIGHNSGGGIAVISGGEAEFINSLISGNNATGDDSSGSIRAVSGGLSRCTNCTIAGNVTTGVDGAALFYGSAGAELILCNTIAAENTGSTNITLSSGTTLTASHSLLNPGGGGVSDGVNGNIVGSAPSFVASVPAAPSTGGDLRLQMGSMGIDVGDNGCADICGFGGDLDGNTRIVNGSVDMGAYEYNATVPGTAFVSTDATACTDNSSEVAFTLSGGTQEYTVEVVNTNTVGTMGLMTDLTTDVITGVTMAGTYPYIVKDANGCTVTGTLDIGLDCVLPVELLYFKGSAQKHGNVLQWVTISEQDNNGFEVQRLNRDKWQKLGFVKGAGTTLENQQYTFLDAQPTAGLHYYRLKQIDTDGTFSYSETIAVQTIPNHDLVVFPNPASSTIYYRTTAAIIERVQVYDGLGRLVKETRTIDGTLSLKGLPNGLYRIVVSSKTGNTQQVVVKE